MHIYERLCFADQFEKFLANKFNTAKRFGLEGGDSCIPGLKCMVDRGSELGIESFAFGMPHRSGRRPTVAPSPRVTCPSVCLSVCVVQGSAERVGQRDAQADAADLQGVPGHALRPRRLHEARLVICR